MVHTLVSAGRLDSVSAVRLRGQSDASASSDVRPVASSSQHEETARPTTLQWDENAVGAWLQELGLGQHAPAFARCRVDGRLLLQLDDEDLSAELGVESRLERKRVLTQIERLREELL